MTEVFSRRLVAHSSAKLPRVVVVNEGSLVPQAVHTNEQRIPSQVGDILILREGVFPGADCGRPAVLNVVVDGGDARMEHVSILCLTLDVASSNLACRLNATATSASCPLRPLTSKASPDEATSKHYK